MSHLVSASFYRYIRVIFILFIYFLIINSRVLNGKLQRHCRLSQIRLCIDLKTCFSCVCVLGVKGGQSHDSGLSPLRAETKAVSIAPLILCEPSYCLLWKHARLLTAKCWTPRRIKPDWFVFSQCIVQQLQLYILREVIFMVALSKSSSVVLGFSLLKKFYMIIKKSLLEKRLRKHHV